MRRPPRKPRPPRPRRRSLDPVPSPDPDTDRYLHYRQVAKALNNRLLADLPTPVLHRAAERLNMLNPDGPGIAADSDYDQYLLYDHALYDLRNADGNNVIDDFAEWNAATLTDDERRVLVGARAARYGVFRVVSIAPGRGAELEPHRPDEPQFFLHDVSLGSSLPDGVLLATRVMTVDGLHMTTGAGIPVLDRLTAIDLMAFLVEWEDSPGPHDPAEFSAEVINLLLDAQATLFMRSHDPRKPVPRTRKPKPPEV